LGDRLDTHRKQVQAAHPEITITGMYNLLEKLRAGQPFTDGDREYNNKALVSTLKQIHDELDTAVLEAYGWQDLITAQQTGKTAEEINETILERLVALNAERAAEERNGHIRWLRPEYQAPDQAKPTQTTLEGMGIEEETAIHRPCRTAKMAHPTQSPTRRHPRSTPHQQRQMDSLTNRQPIHRTQYSEKAGCCDGKLRSAGMVWVTYPAGRSGCLLLAICRVTADCIR
jgi:hypothetical protein